MEGDCTEISAGGLQTSILVDDERVAHYGVQVEGNDDRGKATSWIASEVDKEFAINVSVKSLPKSNAYGVLVYIDGLLVSSSFFCADSDKRSRIITGVRISQTEKRKFMFGALEFLEDDSNAEAASAKTLGQIGIVLQTSTKPETRRPPDAPDSFVVPSHEKVYEGSSKGMAHQVKYSEPREDRLASPKKLFNLKDPFTVAKHVIKYRPLAMLQANGIVARPLPPAIERTPEAPSSTQSPALPRRSRKGKPAEGQVKTEAEAEAADPEERIRKRRRELMAELAKLEEEEDRLRASKRMGRTIKQEIKHEPRGTTASGEVIDLTI
ncbi:hypothetical protein D9619_011663 [Psilocybe cf. subviscida]|uniref:DUF7918 domain-containing protein n=1 Tax=Psilocybe cf. subviscida TaxID=2480587 RepID=A0A8H5BSK5_9AGAR|nr:hypothetical protein D9619_011663 [Psilocybe cf. subviscida]